MRVTSTVDSVLGLPGSLFRIKARFCNTSCCCRPSPLGASRFLAVTPADSLSRILGRNDPMHDASSFVVSARPPWTHGPGAEEPGAQGPRVSSQGLRTRGQEPQGARVARAMRNTHARDIHFALFSFIALSVSRAGRAVSCLSAASRICTPPRFGQTRCREKPSKVVVKINRNR